MAAQLLNEAHSASIEARAGATAQGSSSAGGGVPALVVIRARRP